MSQPITQELIEDTLKKGFIFLLFPRALEKEFKKDFSIRYLNYRRMVLLLAGFIILILGVLDLFILAESWQEAFVIRYAIALPVFILFFMFSWSKKFVFVQDITLTINFCFISVMLLLILATGSPFGLYIYSTAVVLMIFYAGIMLKLNFWYAVFCIAFMVLGDLILLIYIRDESIGLIAAQAFFNLSAAAMATLAAYYFEYVPRYSFLTQYLLEIEKEALYSANAQLTELASLDGLTGIGNRRLLDEKIHEEWLRARRENYPLALLLLDVDHFKNFNDTYGHQAGDDCLIVLASVLKKAVQRPADLAARYGGEEFVALLPNSSSEDAMDVAEKIRKGLEDIGIAHTSSPVAPVVTISIGVVCEIPFEEDGVKNFLQHADEALYHAKGSGKNKAVLYDSLVPGEDNRQG